MEYIYLSRYSRASGSYHIFLDRKLLLTSKLLNEVEVISSTVLRCHHHDSVNRYGVSVSHMTTNMFCLSQSQTCPIPIRGLSQGL